MVLKENRETSGSMLAEPSMLVDSSNHLHVFIWEGSYNYRDHNYDGSWADTLLFSENPQDSPWVNTASIATTGLSGGLGTDKNALLIDASGDIHLLYYDYDSGNKFRHRVYDASTGWSNYGDIYSPDTSGDPRPWTKTIVFADDGSRSGSAQGSPAMVVDEQKGVLNGGKGDNIHFFRYDASSTDWLDRTYTWYDDGRVWRDETLFNCVSYATLGYPWEWTASISDSGLSGSMGLNHNAILVDTTGRLNMLYYDDDSTFNHRAFVRVVIL